MHFLWSGEPYGIREKPMYGMRIVTFTAVLFQPWLTLGASYGAQGTTYPDISTVSWITRTDGATSDQFPFGFVQLGTNAEQKTDNSPDSSWPLIRWHQTADHGVAPNMWVPQEVLVRSWFSGGWITPSCLQQWTPMILRLCNVLTSKFHSIADNWWIQSPFGVIHPRDKLTVAKRLAWAGEWYWL